jgi:hypothetical protein
VQRVCRYPLLFAELLKQTPVCDCPDSHLEIEKILLRMRETTATINKATDDPKMKASIEHTWLLQDRVVFGDQVRMRLSHNFQIRKAYSLITSPHLYLGLPSEAWGIFTCVGPYTLHGKLAIVLMASI